ncbi:MAG: iron ABC transporter permease [Anaerolineae bacterium]|nr:iron ABC transporter permease [Anaerolineae bacterium]MDW8171307.1 iron ABC transporter permease [Anaerolineae bacterium]
MARFSVQPFDLSTFKRLSWPALRLDWRGWLERGRAFPWLSALIAALVMAPLALLAAELLTPNLALWEQLWRTILPSMMVNTLMLVIGVGAGTILLGTGTAWLVSAYSFPLRSWFDKLLLLPLAIPTFVMGFVFMALFDYAGPVATWWRQTWGQDFPPIRSIGGAILVMSLVLYPYVYVLARAAFREQSASTVEAARTLGLERGAAFWRLILPLARPQIAAGGVLAMMEALTDYGTVRFYSVPTLSEGIVRVWEVRADRASAIELAGLLMLFALGMMILERALRGRARYYQQGGGVRGQRLVPQPLYGWRAWAATGVCAALLGLAFVLPATQLVAWTIAELSQQTVGGWQQVYLQYVGNSMTLAGLAAGLVLVSALILMQGVRSSVGRARPWGRRLARLANLGYAMPGAIVAVGVLLLLSPLDHAINDLALSLGLRRPGLVLTGTLVGLSYAYVVRFMAVGYQSVESSFEKITPSMEQAARLLGAGRWRRLWRVQVPLLSAGLAAGAVLVFVDVMKELPATLLLRPFGMDTLALWAYFLAAESFWQAAALPSLTILVAGLLPVILLMRVGRT